MNLSTLENPEQTNAARQQSTAERSLTEAGVSGEAQPAGSLYDTPIVRRRGRRVPRRELAAMTAQLAIMTKSGVDVASALMSLARQSRNQNLRHILEDVHADVIGGNSFSGALAAYSHVFGGSFVASVAAGESAGKLPDVLRHVSRLQRNEIRLRSTVRTMMTYPVLLMCASGSVLAVLVLVVLPEFDRLFKQFDHSLPIITQMLITVSSELRDRWWLWLPVFALGSLGLALFNLSNTGKRWRDSFVLNGPFVRDVSRRLMMGRACRLLGLMLQSGVPLLEGLRMTKMSVQNSLYRDLFELLEEEVINGRSMGEALLTASFVPASAAETVLTAEKTGNLGEVTQLIGEHYEEDGEGRLRELVALLEPLITIGMGIVVGIIVLAIMIPIFDITTLAK